MESVRIARLIERLPPALGGKEVHAAELSRALADRTVEQQVFCRTGERLDARIAQCWAPRFPTRGDSPRLACFCAWVTGAVARAHARRRFDLVHAHGDFPEAAAAAVISARLRVPAVLTVHGGLSNVAWHGLIRLVSFSAMQRVFAVSQEVAADLRALGTSASVTVRPSGVRDAFFDAGAERRQNLVVCIGRLAPVKGVQTFIEARDKLSSRELEWVVAAGGDGSYADRLRGEIERRPDMRQVEERDPDRLAELLASATAFVLPSLDLGTQREGVPTALLEAIASGTPVIATNTGGVGEVLQDGNAGLLVPPGDAGALAAALERVLDDPVGATERAETARRTGVAQRWPTVADEVLGAYHDAIRRYERASVVFAMPWFAVGGAEEIVASLARGAAERGLRASVAAAPGELVQGLASEIEFAPLSFGRSPRVVARNALALAGASVRVRPRAVNSHHFLTGVSCRIGTRLVGMRPRHVMTVHGTEKSRYDVVIGTLGPYIFDLLLPVAGVVRDDLVRYAPRGRRERFRVVHAGIEEPPPPARRRSREVGVIARLVGRKGHRVLLDAWRLIAEDEEGARWRLEIWGDGPERDGLEAQAARLNIRDSVAFRGSVPGAAHRVGEFPIVVLPSLREGLPLLLIEAMAAGVPVVTSDLPGSRELVGDHAGLLVPPGQPDPLAEGLLHLIRNPEIREQLGQAGRERIVERFSRRRMLEDYFRALGFSSSER